MNVTFNATDKSLYFAIRDTATGLLANGLVASDITSAYYRRGISASVSITPSNLALITTAHTDGGFIEDPSILGTYRFDVPDAAFASGATEVKVQLNMDSGYEAVPWLVYLGSGVAAFLVDRDDRWHFDAASQTTAPNNITKAIGFIGPVGMEFERLMPAGAAISSITSVTVADVAASTEPTIVTTSISADYKTVYITVNTASATAGTYTFTGTILTTDNQTIVGKGRLVIQ